VRLWPALAFYPNSAIKLLWIVSIKQWYWNECRKNNAECGYGGGLEDASENHALAVTLTNLNISSLWTK